QISATQKQRISGGKMILQYPYFDGEKITTKTQAIPLKSPNAIIWAAGYSVQTKKSEWAAAIEWDGESGEKKLSAEWKINL
ncbi:MAG: hypothetical protein ACR2P5_06695, partial [Gammaproteobacteria bacterium]